ncbi:hypothetical protein CS022_20060 [Veronia nyctiphanis]|uniref:DUF2024 domain-containing protein n=1 Tax=Veronia nyctiphanis TaxID=1278244 RepID=A0A4Q0YLR0_9GAMM|nr:DUF2024 family protein [Veronia nyctiphanis]RXJ71742.1 hypothetical protein CS022_20060 [Veronia nyctiphanis]
MAVHVYDTYATSKEGKILHFDVLMPVKDDDLAVKYAKNWLSEIGLEGATVKSGNCAFCHTRNSVPQYDEEISSKGYAIYKLEGCPE